MFHGISQASSLLLTPTNALTGLLACGLIVALVPRVAVPGRRLVTAATIALATLAIFPVGDWLLAPLETRFPGYRPTNGSPVAGIIVLGGSVSLRDAPGAPHPQPNEATDRLFEAARLARDFPGVRVLVSGGPVDPATNVSEADLVAGYLEELGVAPARILRERRSQDTYENARFSAALVHPTSRERWLLVTSAYHMPRAVGCFRPAGFTVSAAPADWRGNREGLPTSWSASANLRKVDVAWKEYVGLVAYRLRGRTTALFPGPLSPTMGRAPARPAPIDPSP